MSVEATKNIINTPKIAIEKSPIVVKPNVVTPIKIATKPKIVDKSEILIEKKSYLWWMQELCNKTIKKTL